MYSPIPGSGRKYGGRIVGAALACATVVGLLIAQMAAVTAATLDQVRQSSKLTLGYRVDAAPFSYQDAAQKPAGFTVTLCQKVADALKSELGLAALNVEWVPVTLADRFNDLQQGKVDLLCGADTATLSRMKEVAFSIPIFPGGIGAMLRSDGDPQLRALLADAPPLSHPIWRGAPARTFLEKKTFSVVSDTTSETWLASRMKEFQIEASVVPVANYDAGIKRVLDRSSDAFFGDRPILFEAARKAGSEDLVILDHLFTYEPLAIVLRRNDDDLHVIVDRAVSRLFRSSDMSKLYTAWFGRPGSLTTIFYQLSALPE